MLFGERRLEHDAYPQTTVSDDGVCKPRSAVMNVTFGYEDGKWLYVSDDGVNQGARA